jgi:hypothetical protein
MLRVTIHDDSKANGKGLDRIFEAFEATLDDVPDVFRQALPAIRKAHAEVFSSEGSAGRGRWAALAPRTQIERARLGYGPRSPILVRTGALRRHVLTAPAKITRGSGFVRLEIRPGDVVAGVPKYRALALGAPSNNLPARPMVALGPANAARVTSAIQRALRARAAANGLGSNP